MITRNPTMVKVDTSNSSFHYYHKKHRWIHVLLFLATCFIFIVFRYNELRHSEFRTSISTMMRKIKGWYWGRKDFRFYRPSRRSSPGGKQQTKGSNNLMGFLDDGFRMILGPELESSLRHKWLESKPFRDRYERRMWEAYEAVPRADLILTALGTALGVVVVRRAVRRFRTAQEIPLDYFRKQKVLKGYAISVNDSDNLRFYHQSPLKASLFFWRRPSLKRTDLKYETINVRLAGIDAPEMAHFGGECQPFAKEAKEWLTKYVEGKKVTIQLFRFDQYARAVAAVYVGRIFKRNVSVEMVKAGFATIYEDAGAEYGTFEQELRRLEKEAKSKKKGMWKQSWTDYVSPSQYKKALRSVDNSAASNASGKKWAFWK